MGGCVVVVVIVASAESDDGAGKGLRVTSDRVKLTIRVSGMCALPLPVPWKHVLPRTL